MNRIAIVRVRSGVKAKKDIKDAMKLLRLYNANTCVVVKDTEAILGMLNMIKDYVTWGEINPSIMKMLLTERGRLMGKKRINEVYLKSKLKMGFDEFIKEFFEFKKELKDIPGLKLFFRLKPPDKGFDREGIKKPYSLGGALGYRKDNINDLISRMI